MDTPLQPTPASQWKGREKLQGQDVPLPSGNVARIKPLSPTAFLAEGLIPDSLSAIVRKAIHTKQGLNPKDLEKITDDPEQIVGALKMFDTVLCHVMVEPQVFMPPPCDMLIDTQVCGEYADHDVHKTPNKSGHHAYHEGIRDPNTLYADVVDMDDKMFVFQWCLGGTKDLEQFREEQRKHVEALSDSKDAKRPAKRPARRS